MERKQRITKLNYKKPGNFMGSQPCKKHPKHKQSPGVCSICLGERLIKVSNTSYKPAISNSSSSSGSYVSSLSSSSDSSYLSPVVTYTCRLDSELGKSIRVFKNVDNVIKKSRSMTFGLRRRKEKAGSTDEHKGRDIDIRRGFWSKWLPRKSGGLVHSETMRENVVQEVL
ncbi:hypothetical protein F511_07319 [Dorcoceras hygrometricum]|uniref:Uncharacterized protein n=1 Tax=Dorcoceras hygrometricum TaxID=472368 RepID=A0A2Z7CSR5_9LAMI|nr:hypothetical protein F511_07319 [Dorcoceras hygrometricum]